MKRRLGVNRKESVLNAGCGLQPSSTLPPQSAAAWRHIAALLCPFVSRTVSFSNPTCTAQCLYPHSICTLLSAVASWCLSMSSLPYTLARSYSLTVSRRLNKLELLHHWGLWTCYTHGLENLSPGSHTALLLPFRSLLIGHRTGSVFYCFKTTGPRPTQDAPSSLVPKERASCFFVLFVLFYINTSF